MSLYHTNTSGPNVDAVQAAVRHAAILAKKSKSNVVLYVPAIKNFRHGIIESAIGEQAVDALVEKKHVQIGDVQVMLRTKRRSVGDSSSIIVACHLSSDLVEAAVGALTVGDLIFVPWAPIERDEYLTAHPDSKQIFPEH